MTIDKKKKSRFFISEGNLTEIQDILIALGANETLAVMALRHVLLIVRVDHVSLTLRNH